MKLDPITEYIILKEDPISAALGIASVVALAMIVDFAHETYKDYIDKYGKKCRDFRPSTPSRHKCELSLKIDSLIVKINTLKSGRKYCKKSKHPNDCIKGVNKEIQKNLKRLKKAKEDLEYWKKYKINAG